MQTIAVKQIPSRGYKIQHMLQIIWQPFIRPERIPYVLTDGVRRLYDHLHNPWNKMTWGTRWSIAIKIGKALRYMFNHCVVYQTSNQSLTSYNILMDKNNAIKLVLPNDGEPHPESSVRWRSPETQDDLEPPCYSSDSYSYAMVLWEIGKRKMPFRYFSDDYTVKEKVKSGMQELIPKHFPEIYATLIASGWKTKYERPYAYEMLKTLEDNIDHPSVVAVRNWKG